MMPSLPRRSGLAALVCLACGQAPDTATVSIADSAAVRIVTNVPGSIDAADGWSLAAAPAVEIGGGASPAVPLFQVTAVRPLAGGRVLVGTNGPPQVLLVEPDGTLVATLGRHGEGPGEFSSVGSVVPIAGDSVVVWDPDRRRIAVFAEDGAFAREVELSGVVPLSPLAAPSTRVPAGFTHLLRAAPGSLVAFTNAVWGPEVPEAGVFRLEMRSYRIDMTGAELARYGPFPGWQLYRSDIGEIPFPFGAVTRAATSGEALVVGTAEFPELRFYAPDGSLERIVRWPDHDRTTAGSPLTEEFATWLEAQFARRDPREQALFRETFAAIPRPDLFPAYGDVVAGENGAVWVGAYPGQLGLIGLSPETRRMPSRRWLVFRPDGALLATVQTPEGFEPHEVREGRVWGVFRDELDVESVRAYDIVRP